MSATEESADIVTRVVKDTCYLSKLPLPPSSSYNEIVQVIVGKEVPKVFHVHKGLLAHYSEYFARAFGNDNWIEAHGIVRLEEDDPEVFQLFQNFIYTGRLTDDLRLTPHIEYVIKELARPVRLELKERQEKGQDTSKRREYAVPLPFSMLARLLAFAQMRVVSTLTDSVNALIVTKVLSECYIPLDFVQKLSELDNSEGRTLAFLCYITMFAGNRLDFGEHCCSLPQAFVEEMARFQLHAYDYHKGHPEASSYNVFNSCIAHKDRCSGSSEQRRSSEGLAVKNTALESASQQ